MERTNESRAGNQFFRARVVAQVNAQWEVSRLDEHAQSGVACEAGPAYDCASAARSSLAGQRNWRYLPDRCRSGAGVETTTVNAPIDANRAKRKPRRGDACASPAMLRAAPLGWQLAILRRVPKQKVAATESVEPEPFGTARNALTFVRGCSSWGDAIAPGFP